MCVIIYKPKGINFPSEEILENCWWSNWDGAGVGWKNRKGVKLQKGFMDYENLLSFLSTLSITDEVIIHFRIATSGGVNPTCTHPFPISNRLTDLRALTGSFSALMAHNGILGQGDDKAEISDTMEFIADIVSSPIIRDNLDNRYIKDYLSLKSGSSKLIFMGNFPTFMLGKWIEVDGLLFSNDSFKPYTSVVAKDLCIFCGNHLTEWEVGNIITLECPECEAIYDQYGRWIQDS